MNKILKSSSVRPELSTSLTVDVFNSYYWEKKELTNFCSKHKLSSSGSKLNVTNRIKLFLSTGKVELPDKVKRNQEFDSELKITLSSKVVNFKCDSVTRKFFIKHIGNQFKFNEYLRQFAKTLDLNGSLSYKDLLDGWVASEEHKKNSKEKSKISEQFQFNQFQRDFYSNNQGKKRKEMLDAWKVVRSVSGPTTYEHFLQIKDSKE